jgi:hypothetical protein
MDSTRAMRDRGRGRVVYTIRGDVDAVLADECCRYTQLFNNIGCGGASAYAVGDELPVGVGVEGHTAVQQQQQHHHEMDRYRRFGRVNAAST